MNEGTISSQSLYILDTTKIKPVLLYPTMVHQEVKDKILLFESKNVISCSQFLTQIRQSSIDSTALKKVAHFQSNKSNYWMLIPISVIDTSSLGIAMYLRGAQNDSIWVLDHHFSITQKYKIPLNNFKLDLTKDIPSGNLPGLALPIYTTDAYILINTINYSYSNNNYPILFDSRYYTEWYFSKHNFRFAYFVFLTGIEIGLILYFLLHYILIREKYLLWYIFYVAAQMFPNLDYVYWLFSDIISFPYSWFHFKMFHFCSIFITYLFFVRYILTEPIRLFNWAFRIIVTICIFIFVIDIGLMINGSDYWSDILYSTFRSVLSIFCLAITIYILFYNKISTYKLLFYGTLCLVLAEIIGWFFASEYRSYIINFGILAELLVFSFLINQMIKKNEIERQLVKKANENLIQEREEWKHNLAQDIHDEVGSIITKLNLELHLDKLKRTDPIHIKSLNTYQIYVEKLRDGLKDLVEIIDDSKYDLIDLKALIKDVAFDYLKNTTIHLKINMPDQNINPNIPYQVKRHLQAILKEALQNVLKHAQATTVDIDMTVVNNQILLIVRDDGIGFDTAISTKGKGFLYMKQRIKNVNGNLTIRSNANEKGTNLLIEIPI
jgi:signal transduction histidine kinase